MAYDEGLAERIRESLEPRTAFKEKKMFGGLAFMVRGNMCVCAVDERLMARVGPDRYAEALARKHVKEMDFTGKPMRGYVFVEPKGYAEDADLAYFVDRSLAFNAELPEK